VVYDSEPTPTPIVGAIVREAGSTKGVVTNQKGEFSIETSTGKALLFTYIGYEPEQIGVGQLYKENQECAVHLKHTSTTKVYDVVEEMPQFPGGIEKMMAYLTMNLRYPKEAEEKGLQGRVIANFVIEPDGSITNAKGETVSTEVGTVSVTLDDTSTWTLTGDSYITEFSGNAENVISNGYTLYVNGTALTGTK
jgi:hypothetical protein